MKNNKFILVLAAMVVFAASYAQSGRDYISIVGSSTVYPFATTVAEQFRKDIWFQDS